MIERGQVVLCYVGTVEGFGRFASRVLRKGAMRGDQLTNPAHRARLRRELRRAEMQDLALQIHRGCGGDVA